MGGLVEDVKAVDKKVEGVQTELDKHIAAYQEDTIAAARTRILRFNDEILQKQKHTKEHFDEILADVDDYEDYCADHPKYPNNKAVLAIKHIKETYEHCLAYNGFLSLDEEIVQVRKKRVKEEASKASE